MLRVWLRGRVSESSRSSHRSQPLPHASDYWSHDLQEMVCLEPAVAGSGPVTLEPGKTWTAKQTLSIRHF